MTDLSTQKKNRQPDWDMERGITPLIQSLSAECNRCGLCRKHCGFLEQYGTPGEIADAADDRNQDPFDLAFACSLCNLCTAICPRDVDPAAFFLEMRRTAAFLGKGRFKAHKRLLAFEARGTSPLFSWYGFPENCDTVFFPGCALPGSRPGQTLALFRELQQHIPTLGIALDCCTKPSHDLGRMTHFKAFFGSLRKHFLSSGIRSVITACPNCHQVFGKYGSPLRVENAYQLLSETSKSRLRADDRVIAIHDPCAVRFETGIHEAVRNLATKSGAKITELPDRGLRTLCCGEGGAVGHLHPDLSERWTEARRKQTRGQCLVTYCAGCAGFLSRVTPTEHMLDLVFTKKACRPFGRKVTRPPLTYWNRLQLKWYLKRRLLRKISGNRPFSNRKCLFPKP
jgi:Fe-S oxidoreductase